MHNLKTPGVIAERYKVKTNRSIGTLGSGNHFIELGVSKKTGQISITVHSGSRVTGGHVAEYYMKEAYIQTCNDYVNGKNELDDIELKDMVNAIKLEFEQKNISWRDKNPESYEKSLKSTIHKRLLKKKGLKSEGYYGLDLSSKLGHDYVTDMDYCLSVATANRQVMINRVIKHISTQVRRTVTKLVDVNKNHNNAIITDDLVLHRKGATSAEKGEFGIIPGDWSTGCFLIIGKGNEEYLKSSSHGAGRVLSRRDAISSLSIDELELSTVGIVNNHNSSHLDEVPKVYKNIYDVMENQKDSVLILDQFKPILNIKG